MVDRFANVPSLLTALLLLVLLVAPPAASQAPSEGSELELARKELEEMDRLEQEAFQEGDCDALVELLAEDVTFFANGRELTRDSVGVFCRRIPRPFPQTGEVRTVVRAVAANAGYVLRNITFPGTSRVEVVTKIWRRGDDGWKMEHFQSTVTDLARPDGR